MPNFSFERTTDAAVIKSVLCVPAIYRALHDDGVGPVEEWEPVDSPLVGYVAIRRRHDGELLGIAVCCALSRWCLEVHNAVLPHVGWKRRVAIGREFFAWLWSCGFKRVIGKVEEFNRYTRKYNQAIGMQQFGINEAAFMRDGVLCDEYWFGISAPK